MSSSNSRHCQAIVSLPCQATVYVGVVKQQSWSASNSLVCPATVFVIDTRRRQATVSHHCPATISRRQATVSCRCQATVGLCQETVSLRRQATDSPRCPATVYVLKQQSALSSNSQTLLASNSLHRSCQATILVGKQQSSVSSDSLRHRHSSSSSNGQSSWSSNNQS
jgi:hypothetical protein